MKKILLVITLLSSSLVYGATNQEPKPIDLFRSKQNFMGGLIDILRFYRHAEEYQAIYAARNTPLLTAEEIVTWNANPQKPHTADEENKLRDKIRNKDVNPNYFDEAISIYKKKVKCHGKVTEEENNIYYKLFEQEDTIEQTREKMPVASAEQTAKAIAALKKINELNEAIAKTLNNTQDSFFHAQYDYEAKLQNLLLEKEFWKNNPTVEPEKALTEDEQIAWDKTHDQYHQAIQENANRQQFKEMYDRRATLDQEITKAKESLDAFCKTHNVKSIFDGIEVKTTEQNKLFAFICNHPQALFNVLALPTVAYLSKTAYAMHCAEKTKKNKEPMPFIDFMMHALQNPKKYPALVTAVYGTIAANVAMLLFLRK